MGSSKPAGLAFVFTPVARAVRKHTLASAGALALASGALVVPTVGAEESEGPMIEEILVTAQKRDQSLQDVPISIDVLGEADLEDLGITDLEDFVQMLPSANYTTLGPGSGDVYIRGISSGGENALGSTPNVAIYLDEQPVTAVNSYLNPHIYDVARIESLAGPQGTLFGANSQSGSIRIITNKPDPSKFEAGYDLEANSIKDGDVGYLAEGMINIPIGDRAAVRVVGFHKEDAGFIDNVFGTYTFNNGNIRAGLTDPAQIAEAADITVDNADVAEDDFNEATTQGLRLALGIDLNDNWTVTAGIMRQELESQGVWDHDPDEIGDLEVLRLLPDERDDDWTQTSLVVEGTIGGMSLTYAGSYMERDLEGRSDYSLYSDFYVSGGFVQPVYSCNVAYFGQCVDPREQFENHESFQRESHELRLASAQDQ
ncbi:MAG: TonB-dependent receptor plug domain-containing protein, partial [Pseudomonadota bacterium]